MGLSMTLLIYGRGSMLQHIQGKAEKFSKIKPWITDGFLKSIIYWDTLKQELIKRHSIEKETLYKNYRNSLSFYPNQFYEQKIRYAKNNCKT